MNYRAILILLIVITMVSGQTAISADKVLTDSSPTNVAPTPEISPSKSSSDRDSTTDNQTGTVPNNTEDNLTTDNPVTNRTGTANNQTDKPEIQVISVSPTTREDIYERISLPSKFELEQTTVDSLTQLKLDDNSRYVKLTKATVKLVQINSDKEIFLREMLKIDQKFFEKVYRTTEKIHPRIEMQKQIYNYLKFQETKDPKVTIEDAQITKVFDQGSTKTLYDSLIRLP